MKTLALLAATALATTAIAGTAHAQASADPAAVQPGAYQLDPDHTQVFWTINHLGFTNYTGRFEKIAGTLALDPRNPAADKLDVTIAVDSINTPSAKLNGELVSAEWFDAAKFPSITFKSTKVVPSGKTAAKVTGDLTMHGVTKPVTLDVKFLGAGPNPFFKIYTVGFEATATVKRSDFGVSYGVPAIGDETELHIAGAFVKP